MESIVEIFQPGMRFWDEQRKLEKERIVLAEVPGSNPHQARVDIDRGVVYMPEDVAPDLDAAETATAQ
ncbi:MAG: hypothetical protein LBM94_07255 [Propionibacteriaceae bacterium]|jgi:hypothetical protein|nr:hypothetical protein [Propionibacteriaceae bacterium]